MMAYARSVHVVSFRLTRMHSSRMRTARSLTVSRSICWGVCMPPAMHAPCHTHPLPCMPPTLPCTPPPLPHTPHPPPHMPPNPPHACPLPHCHACPQRTCPPPLPHTPSHGHAHPPPWTDRHTCKNITFANFVCGR